MHAGAFFALFTLQLEAVFFADFFGDFDVDGLVRAGEDFEGDEIGDDFERLEAHSLRQILHNDRRLQVDDLFAVFTEFKLWQRSLSDRCRRRRRDRFGRGLVQKEGDRRQRGRFLRVSGGALTALRFFVKQAQRGLFLIIQRGFRGLGFDDRLFNWGFRLFRGCSDAGEHGARLFAQCASLGLRIFVLN